MYMTDQKFSKQKDEDCLFSRVLRDSTPRFVGPSVGLSVRQSVRHTLSFLFFAIFGLTAPAQMIKWPQIQPLLTRTRLG